MIFDIFIDIENMCAASHVHIYGAYSDWMAFMKTPQNTPPFMARMNSEEIIFKRIAFLQKVELFAQLDMSNLRVLAESLKARKYKKKEIIFHQGDDSRASYIIVKGKIRVVRISPDGNETTIRVYSEHDMIGEFSALDSKPRSTMAQAVEDCILLEIEPGKFLRFIYEIPELAVSLIRLLVQKLRWTTSFAETIAQYNTPGRLLLILLHYKDILGKEIASGKRYELNLFMNQTDLASLVGARREWINRILKDWRKRGLIAYEKGTITILDLPAVETELHRSMDIYEQEPW